MKKTGLIAAAIVTCLASTPIIAAEPDYTPWTEILHTYYNPSKGMDYERLRKEDYTTLTTLVETLSKVDVSSLDENEQLAFWMNLYNVSTVKLITDNYPVGSIRDLSTDPIIRLNVFGKEFIPLGNRTVSLNWIENEKIREGFRDPRIHFAINCAARSCPPMRQEAFTGDKVQEQLSDQATRFLNQNSVVERKGDKATVRVTKIMDWFEDDFEDWGGGVVPFLRKYLSGDAAKMLAGASDVNVKHNDYDWDLNDWKK